MKEKVLIFINSMKFGGAERVVCALLWNLRHEFDIHLALYSKEIDFDLPPDITILDLKQSINEGFATAFFKMPYLAYKLNRYCKTNDIKISVGFLNRPCYINALMRTLYGFKGRIILSERTHQSTMLGGNSFFYRSVSKRMVKFAYKRADLIIANAHAIKFDLQQHFGVKSPITVIHNPVDIIAIEKAAQSSPDIPYAEGFFHYVAVGGFRKEKNFSLLLDAFAMLKHLPVKLVIVGGGELEQPLRNQINLLQIQDNVVLTGISANPYQYIDRADCMVMSSYVEGFPNVLLEGLACGKPIVSTDCKSGPREILAPSSDPQTQVNDGFECAQYGILTEVNNPKNLSAGMMKMYEDNPLRTQYAQLAKKRAEDFGIIKTCQLYALAFKGKPHSAG